MNKNQLISIAAKESGSSFSEAKKVIEPFMSAILESLKNEESVILRGFGNFNVKTKPPRYRYNLITEQKVYTEETKKVEFKVTPKFSVEDK